jgi:Tfp pilus assembly protein PilZ
MLQGDFDPEPPAPPRRLSVRFEDATAFREEFERNLSNGGLFVRSAEVFEQRELVEVELVLAFCNEKLRFPGEVVDWRPPELMQPGMEPGVAVQILEAARELRARLEPFAARAPAARKPSAPSSPERRDARRAQARVPARVTTGEASAGTRTRDLSASGALLSSSNEALPVGEELKVTLVHPTRGKEIEVPSTVVRHVAGDTGVTAVAVRFSPSPADRSKVERFVEEVQSVEHARRLGGISGSIAELGVANLLQMFGTGAQQGTVLLSANGQEGTVVLQNGMLLAVRLGAVSGLKALVRLLAWREGSFEFHGGVEPVSDVEPPLPLDAALLEAVREVDEIARAPLAGLPPRTVLTVHRAVLDREAAELEKTEQAIFDLAEAGSPIARICDVIPVGDAAIYRALSSLVDRGFLSIPDDSSPASPPNKPTPKKR